MKPSSLAVPGETVLLREGDILRWVVITMVDEMRANGTQTVTVVNCEMYGRARPRKVTLNGNAYIDWRA